MTGFHLHTSNRLEALVERLGEVLREPAGAVLEPEAVIVQSLGMRRWLSYEMAERLDVCANVRFPFPHSFVAELFEAARPGSADGAAFDPERMVWTIMSLLPGLADLEGFEEVRRYLTGERPELRRFQLAGRIADVFDRYLVFRPEMILRWDAGEEDHWQAILWRKLSATEGGEHLVEGGKRFATALSGLRPGALPRRVSIFGISSLPRFYMDVLSAASERMAVHLFLMQPTPEWWGDIRSSREIQRLIDRRGNTAALHMEEGNPLLASLGRVGREFLGIVADLQPAVYDEPFVAPDPSCVLGRVQADIFELHDPAAAEAEVAALNDRSIQVHSCHSPMREVEVLHDQLLALFERGLEPRDIAVMMPDVAVYAPFIEAVFGAPEGEPIPFGIADRAARGTSGVVDAFMRILEMAGSRLGSSTVLSLLETPAVRGRFGIAEPDLEILRTWIDETGIRWGIDSKHRASFGVPPFGENTWRAGLDRLLLGYALPAQEQHLFNGLLPYDDVEGGLAETLGEFAGFAELLFETVARLGQSRSPAEWSEVLLEIVNGFFESRDEAQRELLPVRRAIQSLESLARDSGFEEHVGIDVVRAFLAGAFGESGGGFLAGAVTFCALKPMRSIPFRAVFLLGMGDTSFPRHDTAPQFDLIAHQPRPGDRSTRDDDRYLFLEALLSAREMFSVSYVGQSIRDNQPLPPSVLVSELLEYLQRRFRVPDGRKLEDVIVTQHALQPFSARYFEGRPGWFSYSAENARAAIAAQGTREGLPAFLSTPLAEPGEEWRTVDVDALVRFFKNPAKYFLRERLGVQLPEETTLLDEREPFAIDWRVKYRLEQRLLASVLEDGDPREAFELARAAGHLPPGHSGKAAFDELIVSAEAMAAFVEKHVQGDALPPEPIDMVLGEWRITGAIDGLRTSGRASYRSAKLTPEDMLSTWIRHLLLNTKRPLVSILVAQDRVQRYRAVEDARHELEKLLALYGRGLREPLRFFPKTSHAFAFAAGTENPFSAAEKEWNGYQRKEREDRFFDLVFGRETDPLNDDWAEISRAVFDPIFAAYEEEER